jgi:hypothetical protein
MKIAGRCTQAVKLRKNHHLPQFDRVYGTGWRYGVGIQPAA